MRCSLARLSDATALAATWRLEFLGTRVQLHPPLRRLLPPSQLVVSDNTKQAFVSQRSHAPHQPEAARRIHGRRSLRPHSRSLYGLADYPKKTLTPQPNAEQLFVTRCAHTRLSHRAAELEFEWVELP